MDINVFTNPGARAAYIKPQASAVQTDKGTDAAVPARSCDEITISPKVRETAVKQAESAASAAAVSEEDAGSGTVTAFTSFANEFDKVTQEYTSVIWEHYAKEHEENLTYDDPSLHIWDKYKNPDSPDFRADLSEDERAWAYDHEHDMLNGGKHFQLGNPFIFENPPTLSTAAMQANQACREEIDKAVQYIFQKEGIEVPEDASFRLTVDSGYTIHVTGLEDEELAASIEEALNSGGNGKNLYDHLKISSPGSKELGIEYASGHLEAYPQQELGEDALAEVRKQTSPVYSHYSSTYDPHQKPLMDIITLPGVSEPSPAERERSNAVVRLGAPEMLARYRDRELESPTLVVNNTPRINPIDELYIKLYGSPEQLDDIKKELWDYYAAAHRENSSYPPAEGIQHIEDKYKNQDSDIFRSALSPAQRNMYYQQEMALLAGTPLTLRDPYALASIYYLFAGLTNKQ